jgi:hypothetical protein
MNETIPKPSSFGAISQEEDDDQREADVKSGEKKRDKLTS